MVALKCNDRVRHLPTDILGTVETDPRSPLSVLVRLDYVPPDAWIPQYGKPKVGDLFAWPQTDVRKE